MKKLTAMISVFVVLLLLVPVYAQEETPPAETTPTEEAQPGVNPLATEETTLEVTASLTDSTSITETQTLTNTLSLTDTEAFERPSLDIPLPDDFECNLDVIVQRDDWLSNLAEKFYGDLFAYPVIYAATNAKSAEDNTYTFIEDEDLIEPGWKLCLVGVPIAEGALGFELPEATLIDDTPTNLTGPIKVGGAHALSGQLAQQGQSIRNGIDLAVKEINEGAFLGSATIELIWEDTSGETEQAINAFNKLINQDEVVAIVGPTLSRSAFSVDSLAQTAGIPVIGSSNTATGITSIGDNIFRTNLLEATVIRNTVEQAKELIILERVAMIYDISNPFTKANHQSFEQVLADEEIEVFKIIAFGRDADLTAQLQEIQSLGPDAIVLNALGGTSAEIIGQARQLGIEIPVIGGSTFNSPAFLTSGYTEINGTISGSPWNVNINTGSNREFVTSYQTEYSGPPDQFAAQSYTAMWALANALRNSDSTERVAIKDALATLDRIESPMGLFTFDENRNPDHDPIIQVIDDGAFIIFQ